MTLISRFINFLNANAPAATPGGQASASPAPAAAPSGSPGGGSGTPTGSQHIERKAVIFRRVGPNEIVPETEEQWRQTGGAMEGDILTTRAITASGQLADPSKLQTVCSVCNRLEDVVIRSEISHETLCRVCQRSFETPDGRRITVTPQEHAELTYRFDTWARHDIVKHKGTGK
ncbi:MAG: hypothetical protein WCH86_00455 [Kiritimatiellales bacterium]